MEIIQRFQNEYLGIIVNALWYVNDTLHHDLNVYVTDEIKRLIRDTPTDWGGTPQHTSD